MLLVMLRIAVLFIQNPPVNKKCPVTFHHRTVVGIREEGKAATLIYKAFKEFVNRKKDFLICQRGAFSAVTYCF